MNDLILNLVKFNGEVDFTILIPVVLLYFLAFWLIVSVWVFMDSKSRLKSKKKALILSILTFVFGIPFLLLYILARPFDESEILAGFKGDEDDNNDKNDKSASYGGVNVPVVNFMGKDGVVMSLEIKINPKSIEAINDSEMKIDVSFDSKDESKKIIESNEVLTEKIEELKVEVKNSNTANNAGKLSGFLKKLFANKKEGKVTKEEIVKVVEDKPESKAEKKDFLEKQNFQNFPNNAFKKKKKKKKNR